MAILAVVPLTACAEGLEVELLFDDDIEIDRVRVWANVDGEQAFDPGLLPDPPRALSPVGESLNVLVPHKLVGDVVELTVHGLWGNERRASGGTVVLIREGEIQETLVTLVPTEPALPEDAADDDADSDH